jgi:hypothetical protein
MHVTKDGKVIFVETQTARSALTGLPGQSQTSGSQEVYAAKQNPMSAEEWIFPSNHFWHFGHQNVERPFWVKRLTMPLQPAV